VVHNSGLLQFWDGITARKPLQPPFSLRDAPSSPWPGAAMARLLLTGNPVRLWDATTLKPLTPPLHQPQSILRAPVYGRQADFALMRSFCDTRE